MRVGRLLLVLLVLGAAAIAVAVVAPAQARGALGVVDDVRPVGNDPVMTGFPIDYFAITWDASDGVIEAHDHAAGDDGSHGAVRFRQDGSWGPWVPFVEDGAQAPRQWSSGLVFAGGADAYQVRDVPVWAQSPRAMAMSSAALSIGIQSPEVLGGAQALSGCVSRAEWGADESKRFVDDVEVWESTFYPVQGIIVHHTVTANDDPDPAATVRAIYQQHAVLNGWGDIAYHYLIDESGRVYEGRWSGSASSACSTGGDGSDFARNDAGELVTGGHTGYHNQGTVGVALLGNFASPAELGDPEWVQVDPKPAMDAVEQTLADLAMRHDIDPLGQFEYANPMCDLPSDQWKWDCSDESLPYFPGQVRNLISGHRDWRVTACPGAALYALLSDVRADVAVIVADRPVIAVAEDPLALEGNASGGYQGQLTGVSATHPSGQPVTLTNNATAVLPLGDTVVTWTATDPDGRFDLATQTVSVVDTTPPQASVPATLVVPADDGSGAVVTFAASATDVVDPAPTVRCAPASGSRFPIGTTSVACTASDASGNQSQATFDVAVSASRHTVGLVDPTEGRWHLYDPDGVEIAAFFFGNPGDSPMMGDWDCDGVETPGLYRRSDGYVYLRNSNTQGIADIRFFFGDPGDLPLAGDFNGDGCDTVSIYRPAESRVFIINKLGADDGGLGAAELDYYFGDPGDKPFVGDFDADGIETVGLHRESTGLVYFRNTHTQGNADQDYIFGDPGDRLVAGDWTGYGAASPALFRPSSRTVYYRFTNTPGNADHQWTAGQSAWLPVAGDLGLS
jgi:hypothetical protein